jgi:hypothetical protein
MPMIDLKPIQPSIKILCQELAVHRLDLFGSATTAGFGPTSDVDVLVEFDKSVGKLFDRYFSLKEGLEALFHRPVDVVMDGQFRNPYFRESVDRSRVNVYSAYDEKALV